MCERKTPQTRRGSPQRGSLTQNTQHHLKRRQGLSPRRKPPAKQRTKPKKVEVLQKYGEMSLKMVLKWNFDTSITSALPEGEVPYTGYDKQTTKGGTLTTKISQEVRSMHESGSFSLGSSDQEGHTTIRRESKHFYRFVRGGDDAMNSIRRETMFIQMLEGLHPEEAKIICLVKDKDLESRYKITYEMVQQAYPDIQWGGRS